MTQGSIGKMQAEIFKWHPTKTKNQSVKQIVVRHTVKVVDTSQVGYQAGAYPGFVSMKRLGVFLLPPGRNACPLQGSPQH